MHPWSSPFPERRRVKASIIIAKRYGARGSPCRSPLWDWKNPTGDPLTRMETMGSPMLALIHKIQVEINPINCRFTLSPAFRRSTLRQALAAPEERWKFRTSSLAIRMLSVILRPLMNADWLPEMISGMTTCKRRVRIFDRNDLENKVKKKKGYKMFQSYQQSQSWGLE